MCRARKYAKIYAYVRSFRKDDEILRIEKIISFSKINEIQIRVHAEPERESSFFYLHIFTLRFSKSYIL